MFFNPPVQDWLARLKHLTLFALNQLLSPLTVTVTAEGTTGSTHYSYVVVALMGADSIPTLTAITNGNATLSTTNYNTIAWSPLAGSDLDPVTYSVYRTVGGTAQGLIASGLTNVFSLNDTGLAATSGTAPVLNTTGRFPAAAQNPNVVLITTTGASTIVPQPGFYLLDGASACNVTISNPVAGGPGVGDDGVQLTFTALTAHAHTVICPTGTLNNASTTLTFAAVGDQAVLTAYNGYWVSNGVVTAAHIT
jgi:hypothetical protein